jgi:hypothetical protein
MSDDRLFDERGDTLGLLDVDVVRALDELRARVGMSFA